MKKDKPLVSVMLPSYNHEKYVKEAIESVLNQTYENVELLIGDDGSTDHSVEIIESFQDKRIRFFDMKKNTCFKNWDVLRDHAKGKYVTYLGSDDVMHRSKIEKQVDFLEENGQYKACFSWAKGIDSDSNILNNGAMENCFCVKNRTKEEWINQLTLQNNCLVAPSFMMDNAVFQSLNGFDMNYRQIPDWDLWLRYLCKNNLYVMEDFLISYRIHSEDESANVSSVTKNNSVRMNYEHTHMIFQFIKNMDLSLFRDCFFNMFQNKEAVKREELECEKIFWLLNHFYAGIQTQGIYYYMDKIHDRQIAECMESMYHFKRKDFFDMEIERGSARVISDLEESERQYQQLAEKAIAYLEQLEKTEE